MRCLALLLACLLLTGCDMLPKAREMGDMALLRTMGVDAGEDGVLVSVSTGPRAKGVQAEGQPALVLSAEGRSLSGACLALQGQSENYVFFGYVDQLLLGEDLARESVMPALDYFARGERMSLGAQLWVVRGASASDAVGAGGDDGVEGRLATLRRDGKMGVAVISRTAGEVYADLLELGAAYAPALTTGQGDTSLVEQGYAVLKEESLVGFLRGEGAEGLELLAGHPEQDILDFERAGKRYSVRITGAGTSAAFLERGRVLQVTCRVEARMAEYEVQPDEETRQWLAQQVEQRQRVQLRTALGQLQNWEADCAGLGARAAMAAPELWQRLRGDWPERFGEVETQMRIEVVLRE